MKITDKIAQTSSRTYSRDGYLIVPAKLSKLGIFDYLGSELGEKTDEVRKVKRTEDSLFSNETINSFEGAPITLGHPQTDVNSSNWKELAVGNVRNVRREDDYLVADAWIYDERAIQTIEKYGIEEVSCGYQSEAIPIRDDTADYELSPMKGNHVALVANGRCGVDCKLADEEIPIMSKAKKVLDSILGSFGIKLTDEQVKKLDEELGQEEKKEDSESQPDEEKKQDSEEEPKQDNEEYKKQDEESEQAKTSNEEALKAENEQLKAKIASLEEALKAQQSETETEKTLGDAKSVFKSVDFADSNTVRKVHEKAVLAVKLADEKSIKGMSDAELKGLYFAAKKIAQHSGNTELGKVLLGDTAPLKNDLNRYRQGL